MHTTYKNSKGEILLGMIDVRIEQNINKAFIEIHQLLQYKIGNCFVSEQSDCLKQKNRKIGIQLCE